MDAGSTPPILRHHATDEITNLGVGAWAAWLAGNVAPIGAIRAAVPRDDRGRFDDRERRGPLRPYGPQCDPEETVSRVESRPTTVSQGSELLSQYEILEDEGVSREWQDAEGPD
jgi:hypothetical protein